MSCVGRCCASMFSINAQHVCEITPTLWTVLTALVVLYTSVAVAYVTLHCEDYVDVWHKDVSDCAGDGPILLSRALTSDPFRGFTIVAAFGCAFFYAYTPSSSPVKTPITACISLIGVAFIVSMFENDAHYYIINVTSLLTLTFTCPVWHDLHEAWKKMKYNTAEEWDRFFAQTRRSCCVETKQQLYWWALWNWLCILAIVTAVLILTNDAVRSWIYVSEYLFFWTLFWILECTMQEAEKEAEESQITNVAIQF